MKKILTTALLLSSSMSALFAAEARVLIVTTDNTFSGFMVAADKKNFLWRETKKSTVTRKQSRATANVYFLQPPEFIEAMELYKSRNYKDAAAKFVETQEAYSKVKEIKGNPATLAGFYELECLRRMGDLKALNAKAKVYDPDNLIQGYHKLQYEMYRVFWDAVRSKSWARLDDIANDAKWLDRKLPGSFRAQISYCHGLALEGLEKPIKALTAYNTAFIADFSASEEIARKSASSCLRILLNHEAVKTAMKLYPTDNYSDNSDGAKLIREGIALVNLWGKSLGGGAKLPDEYQVFLKFPPKNR